MGKCNFQSKVSLAEENRKLKLWRLEQEERLVQLKLERELAENQAKMDACLKLEREERGALDLDLESLPLINKEDTENSSLHKSPLLI